MALAQTYTQQSTLAPTLAHTQVHIKSPDNDDGLDALISGHAAQRHFERRDIQVGDQQSQLRIKSVMNKFYQLIKVPNESYYLDHHWFDDKRKKVIEELRDILRPNEIDIVLQLMVYEAEDKPLDSLYKIAGIPTIMRSFGLFISKLILFSYCAGYNDFALTTASFMPSTTNGSISSLKTSTMQSSTTGSISSASSMPETNQPPASSSLLIENIAHGMYGKKDKYVRIKITGDVKGACKDSRYCDCYIDGNVIRDIKGIGFNSKKCIITINGTIPENEGILDISIQESTLKTTNMETLKRLIARVDEKGHNQLVFITPKGEEEAVLKFGDNHVDINKRYYDLVDSILYRTGGIEYMQWTKKIF